MRWISLAAVPLVAGLVLVGCGDDDDDDTTPTAEPTTATATETETATSAPTETATTGTTATATATDGTPAPPDDAGTDPVDVTATPSAPSGIVTVVDVRIGGHENADRIVFEFEGDVVPPAHIEYVDSASECGSGEAVDVAGSAILEVRIDQAVGHTEAGQPTIDAEVDGPGGTIEEAVRSCDFEGVVTYAVGTTGQQPFKVTTLQGPARLVIDVFKN